MTDSEGPGLPRVATGAARVHASFARQQFMQTVGATITSVEPGRVELTLPYRQNLTQQHGFLHAGAVATVLDSACGYAALSMMPPDTAVLTVEYKINLLAPAKGDTFLAIGTVLWSGKTLTVCTGEVLARSAAGDTIVAVMQATIMALPGRPGRRD